MPRNGKCNNDTASLSVSVTTQLFFWNKTIVAKKQAGASREWRVEEGGFLVWPKGGGQELNIISPATAN